MSDPTPQTAPLGRLLAQAVDGVVQAQAQLDRDAQSRLSLFLNTPEGGVALPPLWYTLNEVAIELELAARLTRIGPDSGPPSRDSRLHARLLNPTAVSLYGQSAASGLRVSMRLAPREAGSAVAPLLPPPTDPD